MDREEKVARNKMNKKIDFRSDIQGLRAIAVLAVVVFHFNPNWLPGGFVGVDIFLVISGFLIGSILLSEKLKSEYKLIDTLNHFYTTRFKRIVPAYLVMLALVSVAAAVLFLPSDFSIYKDGFKKAIYFNSNNYFSVFGDYFAPATHEQPLLHTWSLAVEIQFYLLAPIVFLFVSRERLYWVLPLAVLLITVYAEHRLQLGIHQATYYSLVARLPAFLMGGLVALILIDKQNAKNSSKNYEWLAYVAVAIIFLAFLAPKPTGSYPGISGFLPALAVAFIIFINAENRLKQFLSAGWLIWIGALSYSLYLWHWPVLALLRYYTGSQILDLKFSLLFFVLTVALSIASYYFVEIPLRKKRSKQLFFGYASLLFLAVFLNFGAKKLNYYLAAEQLSIEYRRYADSEKICHGKIIGDCLMGDLSSTKEVLVLGDSHGAMLNYFFEYLGKEIGFKARIITASSCVTIPGFDYKRIAEWAQKDCLLQIEAAKKYLDNSDVIFLAASWHWQLPSEDFKKSLSAFFDAQSKLGSKVYVLEQEPLLAKNPLRAIHFKELGLEPKIEIDPAYKQANVVLQNLASGYSNVFTLNFEETGVFSQVPFVDGVPIYYDEHHLNEVGAKHYAEAVSDLFRKILN